MEALRVEAEVFIFRNLSCTFTFLIMIIITI